MRPPALSRLVAVACPLVLAPAALGQFTDEAVQRGVDYLVAPSNTSGKGLALCDLDGDLDPDLVVTGRIDGVIGVYENSGNGFFVDRTETSGLAPIPAGSASGVAAADYDGDGRVDLYFSNASTTDRLVRNIGGFVFVDVTSEAGLGDWGWGSGSTWADYDGDGLLDLYASNKSTLANLRPSVLYHNEGNGRFLPDLDAGLTNQDQHTWQSVFFDYDLDGDPDLYISNDKGEVGTDRRNYLWENVGGTFVDVTFATGTAAYIDSMGVAIGDADRNGFPDMYCTNIGPNPLFLSNGEYFVDYAEAAGVTSDSVGWGALFVDFDLDRYPEIHVCNAGDSDRLYRTSGGFPYQDVASREGVDFDDLSFCTAAGDIDGDGDPDLVMSAMLEPIRIFINRQTGQRNWSKIVLQGVPPNTQAVGAWVEITSASGKQSQQVLAGVGYKSSSPFTLNFGVGSDSQIDELVVRWPGGQVHLLEDLPVNETLVVRQPHLPSATPVPR